MYVSCFDFFKIGIGPSSSHTVGPMVAARRFILQLQKANCRDDIHRLQVTLLGSLAYTGKGHGTDRAIVLGLANEVPQECEVAHANAIWSNVKVLGTLPLFGEVQFAFNLDTDLIFDTTTPAKYHPNTLRIEAFDQTGSHLLVREYYSVGGGFVLDEDEILHPAQSVDSVIYPHIFESCRDLEAKCEQAGMAIHDLILENEMVLRPRDSVEKNIRRIWAAMCGCIDNGCVTGGLLPGALGVSRRAPALKIALDSSCILESESKKRDPLTALDWINLWALAVNEENAAGGRVVTAPTNGAAGIVPAVYMYYQKYHSEIEHDGLLPFFLTATAIANLFKRNASISGAEVGCQGEVGVASSMAAAGLTAALGGSVKQVENAAEIAMEHSLGLTCDPVGGLVQIPCIERNAIGAVKAVDASRLAMHGDGSHRVSLDQVIETMRQTGADMQSIYKETSLGGLAVNVIAC